MVVRYNGVDAAVVQYNGVAVEQVQFNGVTVWTAFTWTGQPSGDCYKYAEASFNGPDGATASTTSTLVISSTGDVVTKNGGSSNLYNGADKTIYYKIISASGFTSAPAVTGTWTALSTLTFSRYASATSSNGDNNTTLTGTAQIQLATSSSGENAQTFNFTVTAEAQVWDAYH